jgi:arabinofuranan 3-O-arabinosyltransferase
VARPWSWWWVALPIVALALLATLSNSPGWYVADARFEHFWAPGRYLARHAHAWDDIRGFGGPAPYFSPVVGAFLAAVTGAGASPALAERLLHATYLSVAGIGMAALLRAFRPRRGPEHLVAGVLFAFSLYTSQFLLPSGLFVHFAISPWVTLAFIRGSRGGGWRWAAVFALAIGSVGALNQAALLYGLTPLVPAAAYVLWIDRSATMRSMAGFVARALPLTVAVSAAAIYQGILASRTVAENLATTELPSTVGQTSSWGESLRGAGFWLTYFPWPSRLQRPEAVGFFTRWEVILATFAVPIAALTVVWRSRWRPRLFFAATMLFALVLMVGVYPPDHPSPWGRVFDFGYDRLVMFRAVRSGYKAGSGWAMGVAALGAMATVAVVRAAARGGPTRALRTLRGAAVAALAALVIGTASFPFWTGNLYPADDRMREVPTYWRQAMTWLDGQSAEGRVLVLPGVNRARYRWGYAGDDIFDALLTRSHVQQTSITPQAPEVTDLVRAIDGHAAGRSYIPGAIGPVARRLGVRWIVVRNDLAWEELDVPRPADFSGLRDDPDLALVATFGTRGQNVLPAGGGLARVLGEGRLPPVEVYWVRGGRAPSRLLEPLDPVLLAGGGVGWLSLGASGVLDDAGPVRYTADVPPEELGNLMARGARLVVTDSNRRRLTRVTSTRNYRSETLSPRAELGRPTVPLFSRDGSESVVTYPDALLIEASASGDGFAVFPSDVRPARAFDGDPGTAWLTPSFGDDRTGQWIRVDFRTPHRLRSVTLRPAPAVPGGRVVERVSIALSDGTRVSAPMGPTDTTVGIPARATRSLEVRIEAVAGDRGSTVGFSEISVPGLDLRERIRVPEDVFRVAERDAALAVQVARTPVLYDFRREVGPGATDEELALRRTFETAGSRRYRVEGTLRIGPTTPDSAIDALLAARVGASASSRYQGRLETRAQMAVDGRLSTGWEVSPDRGDFLHARFPRRAVAGLDLYTVADLRQRPSFSRIREVSVSVGDSREEERFPLPGGAACEPGLSVGELCVQRHRLDVTPVEADGVTIRITGADVARGAFGVLPVRLLEVAVGGLRPPRFLGGTPLAQTGCLPLVSLDGRPLLVRLVGGPLQLTRALTAGDPVPFEGCRERRLTAGAHRFDSTEGSHGALEHVTLASGDAPRADPQRRVGSILVVDRSPTRVEMLVRSPQGGQLVAGPTFGKGWTARIKGGRDLGAAKPLDAHAGWDVPPGTYAVVASYRPQRSYEAALAVSAAAAAACLVLVVRRRRAP